MAALLQDGSAACVIVLVARNDVEASILLFGKVTFMLSSVNDDMLALDVDVPLVDFPIPKVLVLDVLMPILPITPVPITPMPLIPVPIIPVPVVAMPVSVVFHPHHIVGVPIKPITADVHGVSAVFVVFAVLAVLAVFCVIPCTKLLSADKDGRNAV